LILGAVAAQVDIPLVELADMMHQEHGLDVAPSETGASTKMARLRGRAKRAQRCRSAVPHGHWKTITFTPPSYWLA
jgi:hypothetical protein